MSATTKAVYLPAGFVEALEHMTQGVEGLSLENLIETSTILALMTANSYEPAKVNLERALMANKNGEPFALAAPNSENYPMVVIGAELQAAVRGAHERKTTLNWQHKKKASKEPIGSRKPDMRIPRALISFLADQGKAIELQSTVTGEATHDVKH